MHSVSYRSDASVRSSVECRRFRQNLVGVPSVGVPEVQRVKPGDPDESYMVWKVERRSGITGDRMPLGLEPLRAEEIAAIRGWIQAGALDN